MWQHQAYQHLHHRGTKRRRERPLSLVGIVDGKMLNKMLAVRIQQYIKKNIHHSQVRIISGMQGWYNIHKSINGIYLINKMKYKNHALMSVDSEKVFYYIQHLFTVKTHREVGLL